MGCGSLSKLSPSKIHIEVLTHENFHENGHLSQNKIEIDQSQEYMFQDGTVSSPFPSALNSIPNITFWQFVQHYIRSVVNTRGTHLDWIIEVGPHNTRQRLKYSELEQKSQRIASGLYNLGLRCQNIVIFFTRNVSLVNLLYFAVWRINAIVWIIEPSSSTKEILEKIDARTTKFLVCDKTTEVVALEVMKKLQNLIIVSIGKLRRSTSIDISNLLEDDGKSCPYENAIEEGEIALVTNNGAAHTHFSLINLFFQSGLLRNNGTKFYFYPISLNHTKLTEFVWSFASLFMGKSIILMKDILKHNIIKMLREFSVSAICGDPELIQNVSKYVAEQGGSLSTVTSIMLESSISNQIIKEKIIRKGFPNLKFIDVLYGFEEVFYVASSVPPPSLAQNSSNLNETLYQSITMNSTTGSLINPNTIGNLCPYVVGKVIDLDTGVRLGPSETGEICFKSKSMMSKYFTENSNKNLNVKIIDGWVHSGEFGYYDSSGYFYVLGKVSDVIKYYAEYFSSRELELILLTHSEIESCAVIGLPDKMAGQLPFAAIVRKEGSNVTGKEIRIFMNSRVPNSKQLRGGILFLDELPDRKRLSQLEFQQALLSLVYKQQFL